MAILCLATDLMDLEARLGRIIVGLTRERKPVTAAELKASGAMTLLLKDAILPNLVQTLEGGPALVHGGPFGNIAHGCNSLAATRLGLGLADIVMTEAGFGADLGAEKFFDIKCRGGRAQSRSLRRGRHGARAQDARRREEGRAGHARRGGAHPRAREPRGPRRQRRKFGVPVVVALNRFTSGLGRGDRRGARRLRDLGRAGGPVRRVGGGWGGGEAVAKEILALLAERRATFRPLYDAALPIQAKIETIAREIYGADGVDYLPRPPAPSRSARRWGSARPRSASPRPSTRSVMIRPGSGARRASALPSGTSCRRRARGSWWRWREIS